MYTNRAYETSSELDNVSADSANSGNNRVVVVPLEKDFDETRVVSKHSNNKQIKSSTKHIITTSSSADDHKRNSDHRHSNHNHRPHSRKGSRPNESNRQI